MKIYDFPFAPNPRKLRTYLKEKGLEIPFEIVNLVEGRHKRPDFVAKNPLGSVPVLELDDGTILTESLAIIEYLEELHPEPPMIGTTPVERAKTRRLERMIDLGVLGPVAGIIHATNSPLPGREPDPAAAEKLRGPLDQLLRVLDAEIGDRTFVAGDRPTIADCTLFGALSFAAFAKLELLGDAPNIRRWWDSFEKRASTQL